MPFKSTNLHNQNLALRTCQLCHLGPYPFTVCKKPLFFILFYLCILLWSSPPSQCQHPRRLQRSCAPLTLCPNVAACDRPSPHVVRRSREAPILGCRVRWGHHPGYRIVAAESTSASIGPRWRANGVEHVGREASVNGLALQEIGEGDEEDAEVKEDKNQRYFYIFW
jgi:hypothetical protein